MEEKALRERIDRSYPIKTLLKKFLGFSPAHNTILCPFHEDVRKSAKIFHDPDGDRIFCFSENRQFRASDLLLKFGEELRDWDPGGPVKEEETAKKVDYSTLEGFKKGEFDMREFCRRVFYLGKD